MSNAQPVRRSEKIVVARTIATSFLKFHSQDRTDAIAIAGHEIAGHENVPEIAVAIVPPHHRQRRHVSRA